MIGSVGKIEAAEHIRNTSTSNNISTSTSSSAEFIAVARRSVPEILEFPAMVLALQIIWDSEDGIAHRVNVAEVEEAAWMDAGPSAKLIALE